MAGSVFHFDAQNLNGDGGLTNPLDGGAVTAWSDLSGNSRDLGTVRGTPLYQTSEAGINGKNYVEFDGHNDDGDRLLTDTLTSEQMAGASGNTVSTFLLMRYNSGTRHWHWDGTNTYGAEGDNRIDFGGQKIETWSTVLTTWHVLEFQVDAAGSTVYIDGALVRTGPGPTPLDGSSPLYLGANHQTQSSVAANVDIAEMVHYNSALSDADRNQTGRFLADKYGITTTYTIPEPSSFGLVAAFACGLMIFRRRLKR